MFNPLIVIVPIFMGIVFIFMIAMIASPKLRGKMMSRQFKAMRYMMEESADDLAKLSGTAAGIKKEILDENEDLLRDISHKEAKIKSVGIKTVAKAIKEGLTENDYIYCKYCGTEIDNDSKFCKKCGKEQ